MSFTTFAQGVMMRIGTSGVAIYPNRTRREVHPARLNEAITYKIEKSDHPLNTVFDQGDWAHESYRFTYRFNGKTFSVLWHCGMKYGDPKPYDGLLAAISDSASVDGYSFGYDWAEDLGFDWETDRKEAEKGYRAGVDILKRLSNLLGDEKENWILALDPYQ